MFERFTDRSRSTVVRAQEQARRLQHGHIGTEHLLLGLLDEPDGVAAGVLGAMGVRSAAVGADVVEVVGSGEVLPSSRHLPLTARARRAVKRAVREATELGHDDVEPEHILLAIVREDDCVAAQVLVRTGVGLDAVRERVVAVLTAARPQESRWAEIARTSAAQDALRAAQRLAGDAPLDSQHLVAALIAAHGSMAKALAALGIDPIAVETTLGELHVTDASEVTPETAAAQQMQLRVDGTEVHIVVGDAATVERVRRIVGLAGGAVTGAGANANLFLPIWIMVNNGLAQLEATLTAAPPTDDPA